MLRWCGLIMVFTVIFPFSINYLQYYSNRVWLVRMHEACDQFSRPKKDDRTTLRLLNLKTGTHTHTLKNKTKRNEKKIGAKNVYQECLHLFFFIR